jgi:transcriptional regulator of arginine metabolism
LGISRIPDGKGGYRYALTINKEATPDPRVGLNVISVIREIVEAKGLMVIRTIPGNANATAYYIDNTSRYEIAGTIAGDDTILLIPRDGITLNQVHSCLELIMPGLHKQVGGKGTRISKREKT